MVSNASHKRPASSSSRRTHLSPRAQALLQARNQRGRLPQLHLQDRLPLLLFLLLLLVRLGWRGGRILRLESSSSSSNSRDRTRSTMIALAGLAQRLLNPALGNERPLQRLLQPHSGLLRLLQICLHCALGLGQRLRLLLRAAPGPVNVDLSGLSTFMRV